MALQLEKRDELPNGKLTVKTYKNTLKNVSGTSYGRVQSPSNRVNLSNLSASIAERNPGIHPAMVSFVARLLHEETMRQLRDGKNVEVLGLGTAYVTTKGSIKGLKPGVADVPKMVLKFKSSKEARNQVKDVCAGLVYSVDIKPIINTVTDMVSKKVNEIKRGSVIQIKGKRLRIEGDKSEVGLYLVKNDGTKLKVEANAIIRNEPSTIEFILNSSLSPSSYLIEVTNQSKIKDGFSTTARTGISEFKVVVQ